MTDMIYNRDIFGGPRPKGGPDSTLRAPKAADETTHFGAEGARTLEKFGYFLFKNALFGKDLITFTL